MNEAVIAKEKTNVILDFVTAWLYIFLFAFKGLRFIFLDMWVAIFNYFSWNADKAYRNVKSVGQNVEESIYEKTKISRKKKERIYKYSDKILAKYEKKKELLNNDLQTAGATRSRVANVYQFTVRNIKGNNQIFTGTMSGLSKLDINSFLVNEGYEVYEIKTSPLLNFLYKESTLIGKKMSTKDLIFWLTQLSTYLKAGLTLNESVKILSTQMKNSKNRKRSFQSICYELTLGESFSNALSKQGSLFPQLLINMIKAAEATGTLQETLEDMASYYTDVNTTKKQMVSALTYPAIITFFSISVVTFIVIYVVPQFTTVYAQSGIEVRGLTKFIVNLSGFLTNNIIYLIFGFLLGMLGVYFAYRSIKAFRIPCQILLMKLPVFKNVLIYNEITIFSKTFASLLRNNVFITESMDILSKITNNEIYKAIMFKTINNIVKGEKISDAFKDHWAVPDVAYYMIVTGESTGQLGDMMQKVSDYYQEMHKNLVNSLKSFIEPVMIIFLAMMVAAIIIAVIVPMFQLYGQIM